MMTVLHQNSFRAKNGFSQKEKREQNKRTGLVLISTEIRGIKIFRLLTIILLLSVINPHGFSQELTQTLRGRVVDAYTELPLPGATVVLTGTEPLIGTMTDADGNFRIENLTLGRVDVSVSMVGYNLKEINNLLLISGRELVIEIPLEEKVYEVEEVIVKAGTPKDKVSNEMAAVSARSFTVDETERYAGSLGDPSRMATNFAGVTSVSDQRNDIIIRGNSPLSLLWRLEGVEIPNPNHFGSLGSTGGPISMLNNNLLANSDFYSSAFPAEYGNALSGVFDLKLRNGNNQKHEFLGQVGFNGFEIGAEGPLAEGKQASFLVNFRYSTLELLHSLGMSFGTGEAIPGYKDISFKINIPLKKGRLSLFGLGGINSIEMLDSRNDEAQYGFSGSDLYYNNKMGVTGLTHVYYTGKDARLTTSLTVSGIEGKAMIYELSNGLDDETISERLYEIKYTISSKFSQRFSSRNYLNTGIIADFFDAGYFGKQLNENGDQYFNYLDAEGQTSFARLFAEWQHRFSDNLTLNSGIHSSMFFLNSSWSVEPRLGLEWEFTPGRAVSLGAGMHSQTQMKAVYFNQRLVDTINLVYERTNENLDLSRSIHIAAGYDHMLGEEHRLKAEIYYQKLYNIPVAWRRPEFSLLSQGGAYSFMAFDNMENTGTGENKGIELTIEKFLHDGFYYLFTATLFDAGYRGYDGVWRNSAFNNNFVINILTGYEWKTGSRSLLAADIKMVYAGGNRYLEIDRELSAEAGSVRYKWDEAYEKSFPDYFRVNGRITFRYNSKRVNHEWAVDLQNITNHKNIFTRNWNSDLNQVSTSYQMGFMPMMTYRIYF